MAKKIGDIGQDASQAGVRDAFHVPAVFVVSEGGHAPGDAVRISPDGVCIHPSGPVVGIVDPFIPRPTRPGDLVWVFLDPNTVDKFYHAFNIVGIDDGASRKVADLESEIRRLQNELAEVDDDGCGGCYS